MFLKFKIGMHISSWSTAAQGLRSKDRIKQVKFIQGLRENKDYKLSVTEGLRDKEGL